jgi:hypothetical protein
MAALTAAAVLAVPASYVHRGDTVIAATLGLVCVGCVATAVRRLVLVRGDLLAQAPPPTA